jgi:hypothetical protein
MKKVGRNKAATKETEPVEVDPRFAPVVEAFARDRDVTRGKMMSSYGLKVNGKIFAMFWKRTVCHQAPQGTSR